MIRAISLILVELVWFSEEVTTFVSSLPKGNVTWRNLNPTAVVKEVGQLFDLGPLNNFFERVRHLWEELKIKGPTTK